VDEWTPERIKLRLTIFEPDLSRPGNFRIETWELSYSWCNTQETVVTRVIPSPNVGNEERNSVLNFRSAPKWDETLI